MKLKLTYFLIFNSLLFAEGGYDHGKSAGKNNWDISITWNPLNYFSQGQNYIIISYGLSEKLDIHGYYSNSRGGNDNYYGGILYQFAKTSKLISPLVFSLTTFQRSTAALADIELGGAAVPYFNFLAPYAMSGKPVIAPAAEPV